MGHIMMSNATLELATGSSEMMFAFDMPKHRRNIGACEDLVDLLSTSSRSCAGSL